MIWCDNIWSSTSVVFLLNKNKINVFFLSFLQSPSKIQKGQRGAKPLYKFRDELKEDEVASCSPSGSAHTSIKVERADSSEFSEGSLLSWHDDAVNTKEEGRIGSSNRPSPKQDICEPSSSSSENERIESAYEQTFDSRNTSGEASVVAEYRRTTLRPEPLRVDLPVPPAHTYRSTFTAIHAIPPPSAFRYPLITDSFRDVETPFSYRSAPYAGPVFAHPRVKHFPEHSMERFSTACGLDPRGSFPRHALPAIRGDIGGSVQVCQPETTRDRHPFVMFEEQTQPEDLSVRSHTRADNESPSSKQK